MWIVNCILIIVGSIAGVMGVSFYIRNRKSTGNIKLYICFYGIFSALWCLSYALVGMSYDLSLCDYFRKVGCFFINAFFGD